MFCRATIDLKDQVFQGWLSNDKIPIIIQHVLNFFSIQELILHQYQSELPVTSRSGTVLKKPVLRERWELCNDDVVLLDKIGRVNLYLPFMNLVIARTYFRAISVMSTKQNCFPLKKRLQLKLAGSFKFNKNISIFNFAFNDLYIHF